MEILQKVIDAHRAALAEPGLYQKNPGKFDVAVKALQTAEAALATAEERWLELEMKREELESQ